MLRRFLHITVNQLARGALGFASVAEELAFKAVELVRGSEEAVASLSPRTTMPAVCELTSMM